MFKRRSAAVGSRIDLTLSNRFDRVFDFDGSGESASATIAMGPKAIAALADRRLPVLQCNEFDRADRIAVGFEDRIDFSLVLLDGKGAG